MVTITISYGSYLTAGGAPFYIEFILVDEYGRAYNGINTIYSTTTDSNGNGTISVPPNDDDQLSWYYIRITSDSLGLTTSFNAAVPANVSTLTWAQLCTYTKPLSATITTNKELTITASEAIAAGAFVNIYNNSGTANLRNAVATAGYEAHGFVLDNISSGESGKVHFGGINSLVSNMTPGFVYISATPGTATNTAPSYAQMIGIALDSETIEFAPWLQCLK